MAKAILEIKNLYYTINNKKILDNISFDISSGDFISVLGPNGAGKTTLIKNITNIIHYNSGLILLNNKDIKKYRKKEFSKNVAYIPQSINIDYNFSVKDIVLMGRLPYLKLFEEYTDKNYEICEKIMKELHIFEFRDRSILTLSGGEQQRVFIARALAQNSNILVLDEPISELDIGNQINTMTLLKKLNKEKKITIITVLHDINIALNFTSKCLLLKKGKIIEYDFTEKVLNQENVKSIFNIDMNFMCHNNKKYISITQK